MLTKHNKYALLDDFELIECIVATPCIQEAHDFFFKVKCAPFLKYIAMLIYDDDDTSEILGEFYEFISNDNWKILRMFDNRNGASLNSYLSRCTMNHFITKKRREDKYRIERIEHADIAKELSLFIQEEEPQMPPVWKAYENLSQRDQIILKLLVIENKSALASADTIWKFVKSKNKEWRMLPVKRVQDTIAMLKRRALLSLSLELEKIVN